MVELRLPITIMMSKYTALSYLVWFNQDDFTDTIDCGITVSQSKAKLRSLILKIDLSPVQRIFIVSLRVRSKNVPGKVLLEVERF